MDHLKMYFLFKMVIFHCHVSLLEGNSRWFLKTWAYAYLWAEWFPYERIWWRRKERIPKSKLRYTTQMARSWVIFLVRNRPMPCLNQREISCSCQAFLGAPGISLNFVLLAGENSNILLMFTIGSYLKTMVESPNLSCWMHCQKLT